MDDRTATICVRREGRFFEINGASVGDAFLLEVCRWINMVGPREVERAGRLRGEYVQDVDDAFQDHSKLQDKEARGEK